MRHLFLFILLIASCSLFKVPKSHYLLLSKKPKLDIKKYIDSNCLNSEGNGKLTFGEKGFQFQYESFNNSKESLWSLGLYFALMGEEVLRLRYDYQKISGSLYERIETLFLENQKEHNTKGILENVKASLSVAFRLINDIKKNEYASRCSIVKSDEKKEQLNFICYDRFTGFKKKIHGKFVSDKIYIKVPFDKSFEIEILLDDWHLNQWKMTKISLRKKTWWSDFEIFNLLLRAKICSM